MDRREFWLNRLDEVNPKLKNVMGLVDLQQDSSYLGDLTKKRTIASLPFAGRYRIVDFALSSMVNSGIRNVGVLLPEKSRSILDHIRSGKDWDLARHHKGLCYLPPAPADNGRKEGDLKNYYANLDFIESNSEEYVLLARADCIYNMDFNPIMRFHENTRADVTIVVSPAAHDDMARGIVVKMAENGLVEDITVKPDIKKGEMRALGVYIARKDCFCSGVRRAYEHGGTDFRVDLVLEAFKNRTIFAYEHRGFSRRICSMLAYYETNMAMLQPDIWKEMFMREGHPIFTKVKDMAPVQYKEGSNVTNTLVANGCEIYGTVENSVLFRGVKIAPGAVVRDSIIMQNGFIQDNARTNCVVCDKNVVVSAGKVLEGAKTYPVFVGNNVRI